jgi:MFS-type transporter involved in bile tolerance (Atg22 family)
MKRWEAAFRLVGLGWYVGACIFLGVAGGIWLDNKLKSTVFVIAGLILGIVIAFYGVYRMILPNFSNKKGNEGKS